MLWLLSLLFGIKCNQGAKTKQAAKECLKLSDKHDYFSRACPLELVASKEPENLRHLSISNNCPLRWLI